MSPEKIESQKSASLPASRFDNSGRVANSLNLSPSLRATPIHLGRSPFHDVPGELRYFSLIDPSAPTVSQRCEDRRWAATERRQFAVRALRALAALHASDGDGISFVHRQISPATLLVASNNQPFFEPFVLRDNTATMADRSV